MKTNRKIIQISTIIIGIILLIYVGLPRIIAIYLKYKWSFDMKNASSIGIIGSADGPTSIFIASNRSFTIPIVLALLVLSGTIYLIKTRKK